LAERTTLLIRRFGKRFGRSLEAQNQGHGKPVAPPEFPGLLRIHKDMRNWGNSLFCSDLGGLAVHLSGGLKTATTLGLRFVAVIGTQICKTTGLWRTSRCARRIDNFSLRQWRAIWPETRISILLSSVKYLISNFEFEISNPINPGSVGKISSSPPSHATASGIAKLQYQNDQRECQCHKVGEKNGPIMQEQAVGSPERGAEGKHALRDERDAVGSLLANNFYRLRQPAKRRAGRRRTSNNLEPCGHNLTPIPLRFEACVPPESVFRRDVRILAQSLKKRVDVPRPHF
jgi:hypothetical protein